MSQEKEWVGPMLTRRTVLTQAVVGTALVTAAPYFGRAETLLATGSSSPRLRDSFDFGWKFLKGDQPGAQNQGFADASWGAIDLPHDWSVEGKFDENEPSGGPGAYLPTGIAWYRKTFRLPETHRGKTITLEFDGVYQNSEVWINGKYLGLRPCGYIPFYYELTPYLNFGRDNVIAVRVDNSKQINSRYYTGSGINRHTWLQATEPICVAHWGTFITSPRITKAAATVEVKTKIANGLKTNSQCTLTTAILDQSGKAVQNQQTTQLVAGGDEYQFVQQLVVENPTLWSPANPYLYTVRSTVEDSGRVVDIYDTPMGIREALFDANRGFVLNGERVKLNGVCLHHEAGSVGAAVPESMWERRLNLLHEMGCNAIRLSHNPYPAEFLDLCDRMGFLVMAEAFDEWTVPKPQAKYGYSLYFDEWYERDLLNFIHRDRNHPSIVLWSAGNEIGDQAAPNGAETLRKLLNIFHTEDPTRMVTAACDRIASEPATNTVRPEFLALLDVVGYNYVDRWRDRADKYFSIDREAFPQRRIIATESGGLGSTRGDYSALFPHADEAGDRQRFRFAGNAGTNVEGQWKFVRTYDYVSGDFMWTGIDYLGEARWPTKSATAGVIDTCGFKKDGFYFYQSQWTQPPMVHVSPHWNWQGKEGQIVPVICYTNCDTVELFLNGKSLGIKGYEFPRHGMEGTYGNLPARARVLRTTGDLHLSWDVVYAPGVLKAVGVRDGAIVSTSEVTTTGAPAAIFLSVDRDKLKADRRDVVHVAVAVKDEQGLMVPTADHEVVFAIEGEGRLIGVDNGDPLNHDEYKVNHRTLFNGQCLALIQSTAKAGEIKVTATSATLRSDSITLTVQA